jgi:hypothetical protein
MFSSYSFISSLHLHLHLSLSSLFFAAQYQDTEVPQARFSYDLSPMSVTIVRQSKTFVTFVTSLCAIIGGTYTVLGLVSGFMNVIFKPKKI